MKQQEQNEMIQNIKKVGKRIAITILCCIPIIGVFSYLTRNAITSDALQILCFVAIMGIAITIVEIIARKREKVKAKEFIEDKDVFK